MFLDVPDRIETFGLLSFSCCLLGSLSQSFPLSINIGVALFILIASRNRRDSVLLGLCGFCAFTAVTDLLQLLHCSFWGGSMSLVNIILKIGAASNAYRIVGREDVGLSDVDEGSAHYSIGDANGYRAPLATEDYEALAAEAASKCVARS